MIRASLKWNGALGCRPGLNREAFVVVTVERVPDRSGKDGFHPVRIVSIKSDRPKETESLKRALQNDSRFMEAAASVLAAFERNLHPH